MGASFWSTSVTGSLAVASWGRFVSDMGLGEGERVRVGAAPPVPPVPARLVSIYTAPAAGAPTVRQPEARAVAGRGLEGDRYWKSEGSFSRWPGKGRDVTLIAAEALAEAAAAFDVALADGEHRRNLVVEGVPLERLRGVPFQIGGVRFEGVRLCAPCKYLVRVTGQPDAFRALVGRGGLRAAVVAGGILRPGDAVTWDSADIARRPRLPG